ncbi:MAG: hypothetical protein OXU44_01370, partial [Gammaproteobacteria bacterium]|nr:hypothetical protein [Gammaproteobacteria bacterium]
AADSAAVALIALPWFFPSFFLLFGLKERITIQCQEENGRQPDERRQLADEWHVAAKKGRGARVFAGARRSQNEKLRGCHGLIKRRI